MKKTLFFLAFLLPLFTVAQDSLPVSLSYEKKRLNDKEVALLIHAKLKPGVDLFAIQKKADDALFSTIIFDTSSTRYLKDGIRELTAPKTEKNKELNAEVRYFTDSASWQQIIQAAVTDSFVVRGAVTLLYRQGESFTPREEPFKFYINPEEDVPTVNVSITVNGTDAVTETNNAAVPQSLWWIFITAFGGGLLALLTPCVYSMIPVTVSFFTKRSKSRAAGIKNALYYSTSIVVIFTLIGFLITLIFGPAALNNLATNWIANLIFFAIFVVFGISFLGAFEIALPSSWSTKADSKAGTGNFWGIFFMALTLVIVSFSCTGPIIGNLLVLASRGSYYGPLVGMFGFSLALALPFALFAFFPSKLNVLGKAGGWLNSVKVTLGFLELALALKFLSNADLARNWRILDREIFLSLWIVIFFLLGLYLLGKLRFHHDDDLPKNDFGHPYLTVTRLFFAIAAFTMTVYMVPGLWGAPLKGLSAFLPPMGTQDFNSSSRNQGPGVSVDVHTQLSDPTGLPTPVKYYEVMKKNEPDVVVNNGLVTYFDYKEALEVARKLKKPLMLDFTGINCINCRKMEGQVWSDPGIMKKLKEEFVIASLFVDVHHGVDLPEKEQYYSEELKKKVETLGDLNTDLQVTRFGANTQPYYFFLDNAEKRLINEGYGYDPDIKKFSDHLDKAIEAYKKTK